MPGRSEGLPPLPAKGRPVVPKGKRIPSRAFWALPRCGFGPLPDRERPGTNYTTLSERTMDNLQHFRRTDYCGTFTAANVGQEISVCGWVQRHRNLGSLIFVDCGTAPASPAGLWMTAPPTCLKGRFPPGGVCHRRQGAGPGAGVQESRAAHRGHRGEGHRTPSAGQGGHPCL